MIYCAKLADRSMHMVYLPISKITVNVVSDCYGNHICNLTVAQAMLDEMNYPHEVMEWCPYVPDEEDEDTSTGG